MLYDVPSAAASQKGDMSEKLVPGSSVKVLDVPVVVDRLINGGICRVCFCELGQGLGTGPRVALDLSVSSDLCLLWVVPYVFMCVLYLGMRCTLYWA